MSFFVVIICFAIQWFLKVDRQQYTWNWAGQYVRWMGRYFQALEKGHGVFTLAIMILPIIVVSSLIFTVVYHLLGHVGYLVLSLCLLWYCTDLTVLKQTASSDVLIIAYQKIFAPLFWYFVLGPIGLVLYVAIAAVRVEMAEQKYFILAQGVLDWIPIRLLGLTFALAGNFGAVFKIWMKELLQPVADNQNQVAVFADAALSADSDVSALIQRALLIWLVAMALITMGSWFG